MVSRFWRAPNPFYVLLLFPLLITVLIFIVLTNFLLSSVSLLYKIYIAYLGIVFSVAMGSYFAWSASKIDDNHADANPLEYLRKIRMINAIRFIRYGLLFVLAPLAIFTQLNQVTIFPQNFPIIDLFSAILIVYLVALMATLMPFSFLTPDGLFVARINLIAEVEPRVDRASFISNAISSFSQTLAKEMRVRVVNRTCRDTLFLPPVERRNLAVGLLFAVRNRDLEDFVNTLAQTLRRPLDEVIEPAEILHELESFLGRWLPIVVGIVTVLYYALKFYRGS